METTSSTQMTSSPGAPRPEEQLSQLFGSYKAEWLKEQMYDLFTEPAYFPELTTSRPCMLIGGRGTGKTTVLRCLSYEGQFALHRRNVTAITTFPYYGLYYRVNTNRVTAFEGPELTPNRWNKVFAHYLNLEMCDLMLRFLEWYQLHHPTAPQIGSRDCTRVASSLNIPAATNVQELAREIADAKVRFEAFINNVADNDPVSLSLQGAPVDSLFQAVLQLPTFHGKSFFFLIDEYENFVDYQQQVVNTLIKHAGQLYSFKVAVRELGWRVRTTLNENEQLISPADYVRINIVDKLEGERFREFALRVCNDRIQRVRIQDDEPIKDIKSALPGLTEEEEAEVLDREGSGLAAAAREQLLQVVSVTDVDAVKEKPLLECYFMAIWAESQRIPIEKVWQQAIDIPNEWQARYQNYKHSLLYTLRRGKRGIQKYYAGWDVFAQLSAGNIRYLLELVDHSLLLHLQRGGKLSRSIPHKIQTMAAQNVGKKNLSELEGLSVYGAQLTKLLLGLGRVFQLMAAEASGHAPEVNQFHLAEEDVTIERDVEEVHGLLKSAVMHLALLRSPGNKPADEADTKDYDYMMHPIFSAFFVFSYRRKRKMTLTTSQLLGLVKSPKRAIQDILAANNREGEEPLPEQLLLFEGYYHAGT